MKGMVYPIIVQDQSIGITIPIACAKQDRSAIGNMKIGVIPIVVTHRGNDRMMTIEEKEYMAAVTIVSFIITLSVTPLWTLFFLGMQ